MASIDTLSDLLEEELKDIYDAEKRLVKALPKMAKASSSPELREAFETHLQETKGQVQRLEQVFELLGAKAKATPCPAMKGLVEEGEEVIAKDGEESLKDAALIGAAQRVEHYEIAAYTTARSLAERLGNSEAVELLEQTLNEEVQTDQKLAALSQTLLESMEDQDETAEEDDEETAAPAASSRRSSGKTQRTRTSRA